MNDGNRRSVSEKGIETEILGKRHHPWEKAHLLLPDWARLLSEVVTERLFAVSTSLEASNPKFLIKQTFFVIWISGDCKSPKTKTREGEKKPGWLIH